MKLDQDRYQRHLCQGRETYRNLKADPILNTHYLAKKRADNDKFYDKMRGDPVRYEKYLEKSRLKSRLKWARKRAELDKYREILGVETDQGKENPRHIPFSRNLIKLKRPIINENQLKEESFNESKKEI